MDCVSPNSITPRVLDGVRAWMFFVQFFRDQVGTLEKLRRHHGPMVVLRERLPWRQGVQGVIVCDARLNQQVLTDLETFQSGGTMIRGPRGSAQNRLRKGLVAINGREHREKRRLVSPLFLPRATRHYYPKMLDVVTRQLDGWPLGETIDLAACVSRMSLLVSAANLFSGEDPVEARRMSEMAADTLRRAFSQSVWLFPLNVVGTPFRRLLKRAERLEHELLKMIARRAAVERDPDRLFDRLISTHIAEPEMMSKEDLIGQMMFMFSASHETVAKGVIWSLFLLSQHARIMDEVHQELRATCGDEPPSIDELERMSLLDAVTKEAMRLLPPVPWMARRVRGETELAGRTVRPKDFVIVNIYGTHRNAEVFADPFEFRPQRWFDFPPDGYAYLPFGAGPRTCVAKSLGSTTINMMVAMVLQRFRVSAIPGSRINRTVNVTLAPKHGMPVRLDRQDGCFQAVPVRGDIHQMVDLTCCDATTRAHTIRMPSVSKPDDHARRAA